MWWVGGWSSLLRILVRPAALLGAGRGAWMCGSRADMIGECWCKGKGIKKRESKSSPGDCEGLVFV